MKYTHSIILFVCIFFPGINFLYAQDSTQLCKVELPSLVGKYTGECKNGFANGKGEAWGLQHYVGLFKKGLPDGKGIYNYTDSMYYSGKFQDGIREGKGEMHYLRQGMPDSTIKGYWSADEFRGDKYITYKFEKHGEFENFQFRPSPESGNTVTIEIQTTTGAPDGRQINFQGSHGYVLTLSDLISTSGDNIRRVASYIKTRSTTVTYELTKFPASFLAILSDGQQISFDLYKAASWEIYLFINK